MTVQLSLLADGIVAGCLHLISDELNIEPAGFAVLGFGKLGGEELNYSSDIDLVFLSESDSSRFWPLGQKLIKALIDATSEGFLYRVDMRLRPWGQSGALVNTVKAHVDYLRQHGMLWEKTSAAQSARDRGDREVGRNFLDQVQPLIFGSPLDEVRDNVRDMKGRIEQDLSDRAARGAT